MLIITDVNREELVLAGALPVLVAEINSPDKEVQYYCAATLSNLAMQEKHRTMLVAIGHYDVIRRLIKLIMSSTEKVRSIVQYRIRPNNRAS